MLVGAFISSLSPFVLCFGSSMTFQIGMVVTLTIGEALWSPRLYEYNLSIAPRGREATYVALAALPYFLAKFLVGPTSGYLLANLCPEHGAAHVAILWAIIGMIDDDRAGRHLDRALMDGKRRACDDFLSSSWWAWWRVAAASTTARTRPSTAPSTRRTT